ncbi:hypothetical protein TcCL_Unassigned04738, partial [Trypanosoma cruzi]
CAPWPKDVECVIDRPLPPWSVSLPALDPRACVLLLGARDEDVRVCAGPSMIGVCESVIFTFYSILIVRLGDGGDSARFFVCVCVASDFPHLSPHLAVGSRRGCILVFSCDLFVGGASHGAAAVSADGVALGVWRWPTFFMCILVLAFWHIYIFFFLCAARTSTFLPVCFVLLFFFSRPISGWGII